ncbi:HAD domain-containing protein [Massilia aquatica]|uniref:HAD domain-containing protein n=1 Tax=Massilia aquatica TaxID=2609000 RepID=UPI00351D1317
MPMTYANPMRPLLLLDIDDILCLNRPYGGYDVAQKEWPSDLLSLLWHRPALDVLEPLVLEFNPQIVITSSWLRLMLLPSIEALFRASGVPWLANGFHPNGEALQASGKTRLDAVDDWLANHHNGEPYVILDDSLSGTGLAGSKHDRAGRLVMCQIDIGLLPTHSERIRWALGTALR